MHPSLAATNPLLEVGMSYVADLNRIFRREEYTHIRDIIARYLSQTLSYQNTAALLFPIFGTTQPIDRLELMIHAPDVPLPTAYIPPNESRARIRPWAPYEDQRLLAGIYRYGLDDWHTVSLFVGNSRTKAQCSQRWARGLDPRICKGRWSTEEDEELIDLVAQLGEKAWMRVSAKMRNRCDVQCRYRYKQLEKEEWFDEKHQAALRRASGLGNDEQPLHPLVRHPVIPQAMAMGIAPPIQGPAAQSGVGQAIEGPGQPWIPKAGQISGQNSGADFHASGFGLSASGSFFGISPMGSLRFDT